MDKFLKKSNRILRFTNFISLSVLKEVQSISSTPAASHTGPMTRRMAQLNLKAGTSGIRRAPTPVFDKAH